MKYEKIVNQIAETIVKLDDDLAQIDAASEPKDKMHEMKKWFAEKKAIHEVKRLLHEVSKYEKYDEKELEKMTAFLKSFE
ncbi:hypothetical protein [Ligilactobacillus sp. Marseille-Q7487]|mgnify:FL=1|uniref:hypothetical protein n=1 Tax=Ligilactobacillus sp. Marseille-Q7487 TaxID=3022128 RepID=UPI0024A7FE8B|nr:hypothetical protein [Ligilactobacillus sp. Marseille-Q7487]